MTGVRSSGELFCYVLSPARGPQSPGTFCLLPLPDRIVGVICRSGLVGTKPCALDPAGFSVLGSGLPNTKTKTSLRPGASPGYELLFILTHDLSQRPVHKPVCFIYK